MKMYNSLHEISAIRLYYFNFYYSVFLKTSPVKSGGVLSHILEIRKLLELGKSNADIVLRIDECLTEVFAQKSGADMVYCAFACIHKGLDITDFADEVSLQVLALSTQYDYNEMVGECDTAFERFNKQPDSNTVANYATIRGNVISADINEFNDVLQSVENMLLKNREVPIYHPEHPRNIKDTFVSSFTDLYLQLGYTAKDMHEISAYEFQRKIDLKIRENARQ